MADVKGNLQLRSPVVDRDNTRRVKNGKRKYSALFRAISAGAAIVCLLFAWNWLNQLYNASNRLDELPIMHRNPYIPPIKLQPLSSSNLSKFQDCSIRNLLSTGLPFLKTATPPTIADYEERRNRIAEALVADSVDAFVVEPGYTFKYYANVSQPEWEVWEPEERPFLMIIQPVQNPKDGKISANTTFLCPTFEAPRAELLGMPFSQPLQFVKWEEHWNPYTTLSESGIFRKPYINGTEEIKIMIEEEMRDFIQRGLGAAGFRVVGLRGEVESVRQRKSAREIEILRAVNTGTVEAVRQIRKCLTPGLTESEIIEVLDNSLRAIGLKPFFDIVLFDENAANPHGGTNGSKVLEPETFVLIDVGAHLFDYSSDITRTFFPPFLRKPAEGEQIPAHLEEKINVWNIVLEAQTQSMLHLCPNQSAASVDIAARKVIADAGYGDAFTHRVGHGIGIKAHESPYLHRGNTHTPLRSGMTFTSEPGIYLVDKFGVRHEDVFLVPEASVSEAFEVFGPKTLSSSSTLYLEEQQQEEEEDGDDDGKEERKRQGVRQVNKQRPKQRRGPEILSGRRATSPWDP
ncbi:Creatinase/aminopeptidase [Xylona heveae TC161]|uniref:Creatinase/aminopeptidase n=1 Tax=Xylona heveae (strain CBS 132557 / TC161) TaxID=1328760 RepID=A0A165FJW8_XYLHT|nr:Creatinase/aminopeptidase [Xylona heveae TC161]KZF21063.1 Creatinase/aminopeptidase [Xylona heveae TC161]